MNQLVKSLENSDVLKNPLVKEAFLNVDRRKFVPDDQKIHAYEDRPLELSNGQTISQPYTVAFMFDLLDPGEGDNIMDVGYGSGWTTAMLAHIVGEKGRIFAVEIVPELCGFGEENVKKYPELAKRVKFKCANACNVSAGRLFDKIIAAAAASGKVPQLWKDQLKIGGKIVLPIKNSIWLLIKIGHNNFEEKEYPGFVFVPLIDEK